MASGTVSRLWRWPVKGMAGEEVRALSLDGNGVGGDRAHALLDEDGVPIEGRDAPALAEWGAAYPFNLDAGLDPANPPLAMVSRPDGRRSWRWGDPQLRNGLETALGRRVAFTREPVGLAIRPRSVLLTDADDPVRARSNLHLELDGPAGWEGADVHFAGGVHLRVLEPSRRGGVRARVIAGGRVAAGEAVRVQTP